MVWRREQLGVAITLCKDSDALGPTAWGDSYPNGRACPMSPHFVVGSEAFSNIVADLPGSDVNHTRMEALRETMFVYNAALVTSHPTTPFRFRSKRWACQCPQTMLYKVLVTHRSNPALGARRALSATSGCPVHTYLQTSQHNRSSIRWKSRCGVEVSI